MSEQAAPDGGFEALANSLRPEPAQAARMLEQSYDLLDLQAHEASGTEHDDEELIDVFYTRNGKKHRAMFEHRRIGWYRLESTTEQGVIDLHDIQGNAHNSVNSIVVFTAICDDMSEMVFAGQVRIGVIQN